MIKWLEKNKIASLIIVVLIIIEIFYFSSLSLGGSGGSSWMPRIYHFIVFFLLGFFLFITIKGNKKIKIKYFLIVIIFSITYAILDEVHQLFVAFRSFSINDILTDTAGILSSAIIYSYYTSKNNKY